MFVVVQTHHHFNTTQFVISIISFLGEVAFANVLFVLSSMLSYSFPVVKPGQSL